MIRTISHSLPADPAPIRAMASRRALVTVPLALLIAGCHRMALPQLTVGPVPSEIERPAAGWVCLRQIPTSVPPAVLFHEARLAVARLKLSPVVMDSARSRIIIAGDRAPAGRGSIGQQSAKLFLDWQVTVPADASSAYVIALAPGLSVRPSGLTPREDRELALQAGALGWRLMRAMPSAPATGFICNRDETRYP